jgi:hypothetical protein
VRAVLEKHGQTLRGADRRTNVNHVTLSNMSLGQVPEMESVVKFARGFGEPINDALVLAGYERIEETAPMSQPLTEQEILERAFKIADSIVPTPEEEAELEGFELMRYQGANGGPHTLERVKKLLIASNRIRRQAEGRE